MNKWKLCSIIVFAIAFFLLAVISFLLIVAAYSPVNVDFSTNPNIFDESISVEIEPLGMVLVFVFSVVLIAVGVVCRAKGSQESKPRV